MAAVTFTAVEVNQSRRLSVGPNVMYSRLDQAGLSVSDIVFLAKVPNHATVIDGYFSVRATGSGITSGLWKLGVQGTVVDTISGATLTADTLHAGASLTASGMTRFVTSFLPFKVSFSDDAANQFVWLQGTFSAGSGTATQSMAFCMTYLMDRD